MMKKDIYIIKNDINNKVYIGQSVNAVNRFKNHHKSESLLESDNMLIHKAMKKYGFEHFYIEVLEQQVENYDERECYWITYYNSIQPNGYNVARGGAGIRAGIKHPSSKIKDFATLEAIYDTILNTDITFNDIAKQFNVSAEIISGINTGSYYFNDSLNYPLRMRGYTEDLFKRVVYALKYELDKSLVEIAKEYDIDYSQLSLINQGKIYFKEHLTYPIRTSKEVRVELIEKDVKHDLKYSTLSQKDIAKKYNICQNTVVDINLGKKHFDNTLTYPIRLNGQNQLASAISNDVLKQIIQDIQTTNLSMNKIGKKYEINPRIICAINSGSIKKYRSNKYKYPIRNKK